MVSNTLPKIVYTSIEMFEKSKDSRFSKNEIYNYKRKSFIKKILVCVVLSQYYMQ